MKLSFRRLEWWKLTCLGGVTVLRLRIVVNNRRACTGIVPLSLARWNCLPTIPEMSRIIDQMENFGYRKPGASALNPTEEGRGIGLKSRARNFEEYGLFFIFSLSALRKGHLLDSRKDKF